ncbi:MAG: ASPIC/UnbV domain-containing protein, partial [Planctomycetota bacterium]
GGSGYSAQSDPRLHFGLGGDDRVKLLEVRWPDGGLQYLENVPADQVISIRQDPGSYVSRLATRFSLPRPIARRTDGIHPKALDLPPEEVDRILSGLEEELRARPPGYALASLYRARCVTYGRHGRAIRFFQRLVEGHPDDLRARIELACAYVDKIPTCGGLAAIVSKGTLARKSLDELTEVLERRDDLWVAYYCRGMNHLHWPRALRHSDDAVADLKRCLEIQSRRGSVDRPGYFARAHVALGDAHTKAKKYRRARRAWRAGLAAFPDSRELEVRLSITNDKELLEFVLAERSLERPIDTSLSFLDAD